MYPHDDAFNGGSRNSELRKIDDSFGTPVSVTHRCVSLLRRISKRVGGPVSRSVDALDDHVEAIQAASTELGRLRFHRSLESVDGLKPRQRVRELSQPFRHVSRGSCTRRIVSRTATLSYGGSVALQQRFQTFDVLDRVP